MSPAVVAVHDLNAKAATHSEVSTSTCDTEPEDLVNARSRLVCEATSENSARGFAANGPVRRPLESGRYPLEHAEQQRNTKGT